MNDQSMARSVIGGVFLYAVAALLKASFNAINLIA